MGFVPRLSLRAKFVTLGIMGAFLMVQPLLAARKELASVTVPEPGAWCAEGGNPIVDRLLPEGAGGTMFYRDLDGRAGVAFQASGTIGLALDASTADITQTEIHERAHLLEFARPDIALRLMRGQPSPAAGQYAATSAIEHFAEMAAQAWSVAGLLIPGDFCALDSPANLLRATEAEVPGTAGFVLWYLRDPALAAGEGADALRDEADRLIAHRRADWDALYASLHERMLPGGGFPTWPQYSLREYLERRRAHVRLGGGLSGRIESTQITASLALLGLAGR